MIYVIKKREDTTNSDKETRRQWKEIKRKMKENGSRSEKIKEAERLFMQSKRK